MHEINGKTKLLGVIGQPVEHSLSPQMHNALLQHLQLNAVYVPLSCAKDQIGELVAGLRAVRFLGANVTLPFKEAVVPFVDELSPISSFMGSVNTLYWKDDRLYGTTTDPYGALRNLREHQGSLADRHIALLGNGGAARALAYALLSDPLFPELGTPASLTLVGRNLSKVEALCAALRQSGLGQSIPLKSMALENFPSHCHQFQWLINTTPVGMEPHDQETPVPADCLHQDLSVYDLVYKPQQTRLLKEAQAAGCPVLGGLGMLIHQGALSFEHWFPSYQADTHVMARGIQEHL